MNLLGMLILLAGPLLGIAWVVLEFNGSGQGKRVVCGLLAMITLTVVAVFATRIFTQFGYNQWYGCATKELVNETIRGIEAGKSDMVLRELKTLQDAYQPTYENRAKYVPLVEQAVKQMKTENPPPVLTNSEHASSK